MAAMCELLYNELLFEWSGGHDRGICQKGQLKLFNKEVMKGAFIYYFISIINYLTYFFSVASGLCKAAFPLNVTVRFGTVQCGLVYFVLPL